VIEFELNGERVTEQAVSPHITMLDYLRTRKHLQGTKEGCGSGDCGACTVLLGKRSGEQVVFEAVNACLLLLPMVHGHHLVTIEGLTSKSLIQGESLHPVQQAMVEHHGSQCGFCTPGIVMSLAALYHQNELILKDSALEALSGNLCRCTGYRPIVDAALSLNDHKADKASCAPVMAEAKVFDPVNQISTAPLLAEATEQGERAVYLPKDEDTLKQLLSDLPNTTLWAGGTDLALDLTQALKPFGNIILLSGVSELHTVSEEARTIKIGAGVTYSQALETFEKQFPSIAQLTHRIAAKQVRNMGTLGGNIANASPIGDTPPVFLALGAKLELASLKGHRWINLDDFFLGYKQTQRQTDEYLRQIEFETLNEHQHLFVYKISKRKEDDISAVLGAFYFDVDDNQVIQTARIAYGGMAATPQRAYALEDKLVDNVVSEALFETVSSELDSIFSPMSDVRASAQYRMDMAKNLLIKSGIALIAMLNGDTEEGI